MIIKCKSKFEGGGEFANESVFNSIDEALSVVIEYLYSLDQRLWSK